MNRSRLRLFVLAASLLAPLSCLGACGGSGGGNLLANADLANLITSTGALSPFFNEATLAYGVSVGNSTTSTTVTPTAANPAATIRVNTVVTPSGAPSAPIPLAPGMTPVTVEVTAEDGLTLKTYTVVFDHVLTVQEAYLKASNTQSGDFFSNSLALDGDTLVVGASSEDSNALGVNGNQADNSASGSGAVYVFVRVGANWSQQAYLKASNTEAGDQFGTRVAISGDTIVVGARFEDSNATGVNGTQSNNGALDGGAAYVLVRSAGLWTQQAYLKASNTEADDRFGSSVAIDGDTLVVGATREDSNGTPADNSVPDSGAAYVFVRSVGVWSQQAYLKASNIGSVDDFGASVALSADTLAVGAYNEDSNAVGVGGNQADNSLLEAGAAYVFVRSGTVWSQQAYLKASNTGAGDRFGEECALDGDTLAVMAPREGSNATGVNGNQADNSLTNAGAAYVFVRSGIVWSQQAYVKASSTGTDLFGRSVALDGDTLAVGGEDEDSNATGLNGNQADNSFADAGAAYVFRRNGAAWSQQTYVKASNANAGDKLGLSIAVSGDTVAVGALREASNTVGVNGNQADNTAPDAGAVYVIR